jgi:hypothetical protein
MEASESGEELAAEDLAQNRERQQESLPGSDPSGSIR